MLPILQTQFDWQTGDQRLAFIQMLKKCDIKYVWYESQKAYLTFEVRNYKSISHSEFAIFKTSQMPNGHSRFW